jgi:hypothetical protein
MTRPVVGFILPLLTSLGVFAWSLDIFGLVPRASQTRINARQQLGCCAQRGEQPMKIRKTVTPAKVAANQKNSELSTGPTSVRGKAVSRWNSISHGILTGDLLLPD